MSKPKQEVYLLKNLDNGEVKYFASLVAISLHLGKCKSWASYIIRVKGGKWQNYEIMVANDNYEI